MKCVKSVKIFICDGLGPAKVQPVNKHPASIINHPLSLFNHPASIIKHQFKCENLSKAEQNAGGQHHLMPRRWPCLQPLYRFVPFYFRFSNFSFLLFILLLSGLYHFKFYFRFSNSSNLLFIHSRLRRRQSSGWKWPLIQSQWRISRETSQVASQAQLLWLLQLLLLSSLLSSWSSWK